MINLKINGIEMSVDRGTTLLEAAQFLGLPIPTLCHMEGLSPYGACRLCVVEVGDPPNSRLVTSCTYPAEEGLKVRTASARVVRARKMIVELLLASCPQSKTIQDIAAALDVPTTIPSGVRGLHPVRPLRPHVRRADGGRRHRFYRAGPGTQHRHPLRQHLRGLSALWRMHVRVSGL